ncbi:MAG: iron-containing alcohol dehydrogenase [Polyangiaceae bacterium]|nr:iron-containing alcohol dehydrogenase [Polyangiaceae bacterium]
MTAIWSFPTRIVFGAGEVSRVGAEARSFAMSRVLIVTDPGVLKANIVGKVVESLEAADIKVSVFSGVDGNPTEANVEAGAKAYSEFGANGIVAIGGGSPMDAAKVIALRTRSERPLADFDDAINGGKHIMPGIPPMIQIPTTAGTGSEVGRAAVVTLEATGKKTVIFSPYLLAKVAILDPTLTLSMPGPTTAATGFDALTHCLEAYLAVGDHPMADAIALSGIELVHKHLLTAMSQGTDLEARGGMMKAAMMGAVAFQKGLGACHSLAHPLSAECGLHHGLANALCLPAVVSFNEEAVPERVFHIALLLGSEAKRGACRQALRDLRTALKLPSSLREVGVPRDLLPKLADLAFEDACHRENPRPCTRDDMFALYEASY